MGPINALIRLLGLNHVYGPLGSTNPPQGGIDGGCGQEEEAIGNDAGGGGRASGQEQVSWPSGSPLRPKSPVS